MAILIYTILRNRTPSFSITFITYTGTFFSHFLGNFKIYHPTINYSNVLYNTINFVKQYTFNHKRVFIFYYYFYYGLSYRTPVLFTSQVPII